MVIAPRFPQIMGSQHPTCDLENRLSARHGRMRPRGAAPKLAYFDPVLQRVPGLVGTDAVRRHGLTLNSCEPELAMQSWRSFWSAPTLSCWGPRFTPGRTGKLQIT